MLDEVPIGTEKASSKKREEIYLELVDRVSKQELQMQQKVENMEGIMQMIAHRLYILERGCCCRVPSRLSKMSLLLRGLHGPEVQ